MDQSIVNQEREQDAGVIKMNIYQRLNEIRKAVGFIQKDKEVSGAGNYKAVTHDAVTSSLREHFIAHGVMVVPNMAAAKTVDTGTTTQKGIPIIRYEATYDIGFVNCDDPQDRVTVRIESHALDQGDKAPGKAISYATKYAMLKLFSIETGDEEESRVEQKIKRITPTTGAAEALTPERRAEVDKVVSTVFDWLEAGSITDAVMTIDNAELEASEKVYLWTNFDSKQRAAMKKEFAALREKHAQG